MNSHLRIPLSVFVAFFSVWLVCSCSGASREDGDSSLVVRLSGDSQYGIEVERGIFESGISEERWELRAFIVMFDDALDSGLYHVIDTLIFHSRLIRCAPDAVAFFSCAGDSCWLVALSDRGGPVFDTVTALPGKFPGEEAQSPGSWFLWLPDSLFVCNDCSPTMLPEVVVSRTTSGKALDTSAIVENAGFGRVTLNTRRLYLTIYRADVPVSGYGLATTVGVFDMEADSLIVPFPRAVSYRDPQQYQGSGPWFFLEYDTASLKTTSVMVWNGEGAPTPIVSIETGEKLLGYKLYGDSLVYALRDETDAVDTLVIRDLEHKISRRTSGHQ